MAASALLRARWVLVAILLALAFPEMLGANNAAATALASGEATAAANPGISNGAIASADEVAKPDKKCSSKKCYNPTTTGQATTTKKQQPTTTGKATSKATTQTTSTTGKATSKATTQTTIKGQTTTTTTTKKGQTTTTTTTKKGQTTTTTIKGQTTTTTIKGQTTTTTKKGQTTTTTNKGQTTTTTIKGQTTTTTSKGQTTTTTNKGQTTTTTIKGQTTTTTTTTTKKGQTTTTTIKGQTTTTTTKQTTEPTTSKPTTATSTISATTAATTTTAVTNLFYFIGGLADVYVSNTNTFSPFSHVYSFTSTSDFNLISSAVIPAGQASYAGGCLCNDAAFLAGGLGFATTFSSMSLGTLAFTSVSPLTTGRVRPGVACITGNVYVCGGQIGSGSPSSTASCEMYSTGVSAWGSPPASMSTTRKDFALVSLGGALYAIAGYSDSDGVLGSVEMYTPSTNTWAVVTNLPNSVKASEVTAAVYLSSFYVLGGITAENVAQANLYSYTPSTDTWTTLAPSPIAIMYTVAGFLPGTSNMYVFGGYNGNGENLNSVYTYSASDNKWTLDSATLPAYLDLGVLIPVSPS